MTVRSDTLRAAVRALSRGQAVIFPTETVYGLGVSVKATLSPQLLFDLKGRASDKPVSWLVSSPAALDVYGRDVSEFARVLVRTFWPGPLTLIVRASAEVPAAFRAHDGSIGLRMPANDMALSLIEAVGCPLATTSANFSGMPAPRSFASIDPSLAARVGAVLADDADVDDAAKSGLASTVLDCTLEHPHILRQGAITATDIKAFA